MLTRLTAITLLLTAVACTLQPRATTQVTDWQRFAERQQQLTQWRLKGSLGFNSPQDSGSARIIWQQLSQQFTVRLSGLLGIGTTRIRGNPQQVVMERGDDRRVANSSEELTWQLLGMPLSVEALTYWVRGIPDPARPVTLRGYNLDGTLDTLGQDGWLLEFSRYEESDGWLLPGKIIGHKGELSFTLFIKDWQPEQPHASL